MAKPSRQRFPSAAPSAAAAGGELSRRCLSPQGEFRRDPPGVGGARAPARAGAAAGAVLVTFSSPQKVTRPPGRASQSSPTESTQNQTAKIKTLDPGLRRGDESCPDAVPKRRHHSPPAMAKPSRQRSPSAAPSAARGRRRLSRRCLSPQGGFDATRRAGGSERHQREPALRQGASLVTFSSPQESHSPAGGDTRPITANRKHLKTERQRSKPWTPACAGATNRVRMPCPKQGTTAAGNGEAEPAAAFPFCSAERNPRPAGIVASMSGAREGGFRRDPPGAGGRGHRREPALRRGHFIHLLVATRKMVARRGETRPITAN